MSGTHGLLANLVAEHLPRGGVASRLQPRFPYEFDVQKQVAEEGEPAMPARAADPKMSGVETPASASHPVRSGSPAAPMSDAPRALRGDAAPLDGHQPPAGATPTEASIPAGRAPLKSESPTQAPELKRVPTVAPATREIRHIERETRQESRIEVREYATRLETGKEPGRTPIAPNAAPTPNAPGLRPRSTELPPPEPLRAVTPEPVIEIHIGRVEVRSDRSGKPTAAAAGRSASVPDRSLAQYLRGRGSGARS
jgi:hypothetical protein